MGVFGITICCIIMIVIIVMVTSILWYFQKKGSGLLVDEVYDHNRILGVLFYIAYIGPLGSSLSIIWHQYQIIRAARSFEAEVHRRMLKQYIGINRLLFATEFAMECLPQSVVHIFYVMDESWEDRLYISRGLSLALFTKLFGAWIIAPCAVHFIVLVPFNVLRARKAPEKDEEGLSASWRVFLEVHRAFVLLFVYADPYGVCALTATACYAFAFKLFGLMDSDLWSEAYQS